MMKWIKPSGAEIETNDAEATIKAAAQLGWKPKGAAKTVTLEDEAPKKRGRAKKSED